MGQNTSREFRFTSDRERPLIIAGPCMAESLAQLDEVASFLKGLQTKLGFDFVFKASFDKANRTNISSFRGHGLETTLTWMSDIKSKLDLYLTTDVHETYQVIPVSQVVDVIQIPAFLSRQTDLIVQSAKTGKAVNIKKGQFISPYSVANIVEKVASSCPEGVPVSSVCALTERGFCMGYQDLVVDMRSFPIMKKLGSCPIIFDVTHSTQQPPSGDSNTTKGSRYMAPVLARAALITGYVDGFFMEVHPEPSRAKSDVKVQLSFTQAEHLITQISSLWSIAKEVSFCDSHFYD